MLLNLPQILFKNIFDAFKFQIILRKSFFIKPLPFGIWIKLYNLVLNQMFIDTDTINVTLQGNIIEIEVYFFIVAF